MNEDYLWNKVDGDAEIERLENALGKFRYQEIAPPALPTKIVPFEKIEKKSWRGFFRLSLAFGAFAVLVFVCFGIWLKISKTNEVAQNSSPLVAPPAIENPARVIKTAAPMNPAAKNFEKVILPRPFAERRTAKTKFVSPIVRRNFSTRRNIEVEPRENSIEQNLAVQKSSVKFTEEENYAYNQLIRALSITGSQLKLVKDKIDAAENSR